MLQRYSVRVVIRQLALVAGSWLVACASSSPESPRDKGSAAQPATASADDTQTSKGPETPAAATCVPTEAAFVEHGGVNLRITSETLELLGPMPLKDTWLSYDRKSLSEELPWIDQVQTVEATLFVTDPKGHLQLEAWLKAPSLDDIDAGFVDKAIGWTSHSRVRLTQDSRTAADVVGKSWVEQHDGELAELCTELKPALPAGAECGGTGDWLVIRRVSPDAVVVDAFDLPELMGVEMALKDQWFDEFPGEEGTDGNNDESAASVSAEHGRARARWASSHTDALRARVSAGLCAKPGATAVSEAAAFLSQDDGATAAYQRSAGLSALLRASTVVSPDQQQAALKKGSKIALNSPVVRVFTRAGAEWDAANETARVRWTVDAGALPEVSAWLEPDASPLPALDEACKSVGCLTYRGKISSESVTALTRLSPSLAEGEVRGRAVYPIQMLTRWPTAVAALLAEMGSPAIDGMGVVDLSSVARGAKSGEGSFVVWLMTAKGAFDETAWAEATRGSTTGAADLGSAELRWLVIGDASGPEVDRWIDKHLAHPKLEPRSGPVLEYRSAAAKLSVELNGNELVAQLEFSEP